MLKALFLDMDDTLCDTASANEQAKKLMANKVMSDFGPEIDGYAFSQNYIRGIYKEWTDEERATYAAMREQQGELVYREAWILNLFATIGIHGVSGHYAQTLQSQFEVDRMAAFDFYPGIKDFLLAAREKFTLVVITNGPEYSQIPKLKAANVAEYVDHVIIGGQEPAQKPAQSIFTKALNLANCKANQAIHIGDSFAADIVGASNSGIQSVWIQHQQAKPISPITPDYTLSHPSEIPTLISTLSA